LRNANKFGEPIFLEHIHRRRNQIHYRQVETIKHGFAKTSNNSIKLVITSEQTDSFFQHLDAK
jgi:hypothetical protein